MMRWMLKPVLIVGFGPLCVSLTGKLAENGAYIYLWNPFGGDFSFSAPNVHVVEKDVSSVSGRESFLKRPTSIFIALPGSVLGDLNLLEEVLGKVLGAASDRKTRFVVAFHFNGGSLDLQAVREAFEFCRNSDCKYGFNLVFREVYGPGVKEGFVYNVLRKFKENSMELQLNVDPAEVRDFMYIEDAVAALLKSCEKVDSWRLQAVSGYEAKLIHVVRGLTALLGLEGICSIRFSRRKSRKVGEELGGEIEAADWFKPKVKLLNGLKWTIDWFEAEYGPILVCPNNNHLYLALS